MSTLSRAATLPIIPVERTFDEKAKRGRSLAQISAKGLARSMSKIMEESSDAADSDVLTSAPLTIVAEKFEILLNELDVTSDDASSYCNSADYFAKYQMLRLKRESVMKRWEHEETDRAPEAFPRQGMRSEEDKRRREAIEMYEERWKNLVVEEDIPQDRVYPWRSFSDLPWPSFDLPPQLDDLYPEPGRPSITPVNFPITYESMNEFLFGTEGMAMRLDRTVEEVYEDELFFWAIETIDERVMNKVRVQDMVVVMLATAAVQNWLLGAVEIGDMFKSWLEDIAPLWLEARNKEDEKIWQEIMNSNVFEVSEL